MFFEVVDAFVKMTNDEIESGFDGFDVKLDGFEFFVEHVIELFDLVVREFHNFIMTLVI